MATIPSGFSIVSRMVLQYPTKVQLPKPTFEAWARGRTIEIKSGFWDIVPELETWQPKGQQPAVSLTALRLDVKLSFKEVWTKLPTSWVPWCVLDLLPAARDLTTNDILPRHGIPTLFRIPGAYQRVDTQGKPIGDPASLPVLMRHHDVGGWRSTWQLDLWDVTDTNVCPAGTLVLTQ